MFTLALVRFPPTATKEIQYLNAKGALTYTDIAGDPVLYCNLPPREITMKDVFRSGDSSKKLKIAEGQWYRYAPSYVSFFFQAEDGIRDYKVTGVQTCALPISDCVASACCSGVRFSGSSLSTVWASGASLAILASTNCWR